MAPVTTKDEATRFTLRSDVSEAGGRDVLQLAELQADVPHGGEAEPYSGRGGLRVYCQLVMTRFVELLALTFRRPGI